MSRRETLKHLVHGQTQRDRASIQLLGSSLQRVVTGGLNVAEAAFKAGGAEEAGAAGELHPKLYGRNRVALNELAAHHHLVNGLGRRRIQPHGRQP